MKMTSQPQIRKSFMNASLSSRIFSLLRWEQTRPFQKLTFSSQRTTAFKLGRMRFYWRFVNWAGMLQCFERYGTSQKPGNRWAAFWILPNGLEWRFQTSVRSFKLRIGGKRGLVVGRWTCNPEVPCSLLPATRWICLRWPGIQLLHAV